MGFAAMHAPLSDDPAERSARIIAFLREKFAEAHNLVIILPSDRAYIRDIRLPVTRDSRIRELLPFETENFIPVGLEEVEVIGQTWEKTEESSRTISFAYSRDALYASVLPYTAEEYFIKMIAPDSSGLADAIHLIHPEGFRATTVVQIHTSDAGTILNILIDGNLVFTRTLTPGGAELIEAVMGAVRTDAESAKLILSELPLHLDDEEFSPSEVLLRSLQIKSYTYKQIISEFKSIYQEIAQETKRTLLSVPEFGEPSRIYLSGHSATLSGVAEYMQKILDTPVFEYPPEIFEGSASSAWIPIMGTALHYARPSRSRTDFTRTPFGSNIRKSEINIRAFRFPMILSIASTVILAASFIMGMIIDRRAIRNADAEILRAAKRIPGLPTTGDPLTQALSMCKKRLGGGGSGASVLDLLEHVSRTFPAEGETPFRIKKFHYTGTDIQFEGELERLTDVSVVEKILSEDKTFLKVEVKSDLLTSKRVRVNVKIKLKPLGAGEGVGICG
jgi:Tfp pilus assembly PilM family ATPase